MKQTTILFLLLGLASALNVTAAFAGDVTVTQCTSGQESLLRATAANLRIRLRELTDAQNGIRKYDMSYVRENYITPRNRVPHWQPQNPAVTERAYEEYYYGINNVISKMHADAEAGYEIRCTTSRDRNCAGGDTLAFVNYIAGVKIRRIYICPLYFDGRTSDTTLFHELSHYSADTEHADFSKPPTLESVKSSYNDAYHIEMFLGRKPEMAVMSIWSMLWIPQRVMEPEMDSDMDLSTDSF